MTKKYYIKITDEMPLESEKALWFELETDIETGNAEFFVLDRNEYNNLMEEFNTIKSNFEEEYVAPIVERYLQNSDIPQSTYASYLANPNNPSPNNSYSYSSLRTALNNKADSVDVSSSLGTKADVQSLVSLQNTISNKADKTHIHNSWSYVRFNDYCTGYYNSAIRIIVIRYYRSGYNFKETSSIKLHSGLFKNYKPIVGGDLVLSFYNAEMGGYVEDSSGDMYVYCRSTGSRTINASAMWRY